MPDNSALIPSSDAHWYYSHSGNVVGPMPLASIHALWQAKELPSDTLGTPEGSEDWQPLKDVLGALSVSSVPPALPAAGPALESPTDAEKWFERTGIVLACLFCCFPAGLAFLWQSRRFSHPMKIGLTVAIAMMVLPVFLQMPKEAKQREVREQGAREAKQREEHRIANLPPRQAMEHQVRSKLQSAFGDRLRSIEIGEITDSSAPSLFNVQVRFNASSNLKTSWIRSGIEDDMKKAYSLIYTSFSNVHEVWLFAYLPMTDQYGNTSDDIVYKTSLAEVEAAKINWSNTAIVNFPAVWKTLFIAPALRVSE